MPTQTVPRKSPEVTDSTHKNYIWKTILFNCNCHSFDEVEKQLLKSIHCSLSKARELSWQVHTTGNAVVYTGPKERCEAVAMVLEDIGLVVKVSQ